MNGVTDLSEELKICHVNQFKGRTILLIDRPRFEHTFFLLLLDYFSWFWVLSMATILYDIWSCLFDWFLLNFQAKRYNTVIQFSWKRVFTWRNRIVICSFYYSVFTLCKSNHCRYAKSVYKSTCSESKKWTIVRVYSMIIKKRY